MSRHSFRNARNDAVTQQLGIVSTGQLSGDWAKVPDNSPTGTTGGTATVQTQYIFYAVQPGTKVSKVTVKLDECREIAKTDPQYRHEFLRDVAEDVATQLVHEMWNRDFGELPEDLIGVHFTVHHLEESVTCEIFVQPTPSDHPEAPILPQNRRRH